MSNSPDPGGRPALLEVGSVVRAHGLRGQAVVALTTNRPERVAIGSRLTVGGAGRVLEGVASAPAPGGGGPDRWLVSFDGVDSRERAEELRGVTLLAEPIDDPEALWVDELIGCGVVEVDGTARGTVTDVLANPASDLLVLDSGALVPLHFVVSRRPGTVTVDVPAGLFELDEA